MNTDDQFEPHLGYSPRDKLFQGKLSDQLMHRVARAWGNPRLLPGLLPGVPKLQARSNRFNARGRGARAATSFTRSARWTTDKDSGLKVGSRRTYVQYRIVNESSASGGAAYQHLRYLERQGVQRDGEPGRLFSTFTDEVDRAEFLARTGNDPHQFRLILTPEDGAAYGDLKPFARDVMARLEADLDTNLDWVAANHYDTGHPHIHLVVRGVTEDGRSLNVAGDYLRFGIAHRASEVLVRDLGLKLQIGFERQIGQDCDAERLTDLDRVLIDRAQNGLIDLRAQDLDRTLQQELISRARWLERMRLAAREDNLKWRLAPNAGEVLQGLEGHASRLSALHQTIRASNLTRSPQLYAMHDKLDGPVVGRVLAYDHPAGRADRRYVVLDGSDGRAHYIDVGLADAAVSVGDIVRVTPRATDARAIDRKIVEIASANGGVYDIDAHLRRDSIATYEVAEAHIRRLEKIDRAVSKFDRQVDGSWRIGPDYLDRARAYEHLLAAENPVRIETLSTLSLSEQIGAEGATWLDRQLLGDVEKAHSSHGFGKEIHEALVRRQQWLIDQGLLRIDGDTISFRTNLLEHLSRREVRDTARRLEGELHKPFAAPSSNVRVEGTFRKTLELASGRFALIENSREFTLVPWKPEIERFLGRTVSGIPFGGAFEWTLARGRGISI